MKQIYACELKIGDVLINVGKINKITHEQARMIIEYENANQGVFTEKQLNDLRGYFTQQEKREELLGLYREVWKDDIENNLPAEQYIELVETLLKKEEELK